VEVRRLTRRQWAALGVALAVGAAAALLVGVAAPRWWQGEGGTYVPRALLAATTALDPPRALFGDTITARVEVVVDAGSVDPGSVRVYPDFRPYRVAAATREVRDDVGRAAVVSYAFQLDCVIVSCLTAFEEPDTEPPRPRSFTFAPARVQARHLAGAFVNGRARWPPLFVRSRLTPDEVAAGEPSTPPFEAPPVTWRVHPDVLGGALTALAALLALGGGYLVATGVRGAPAVRRLRIPEHLTPVDRALALARHAADAGDAEGGRRALERLAKELRRRGEDELAGAAGRLAWSPEAPTRAAVDELESALRNGSDGR
jgi:hypothetical protein